VNHEEGIKKKRLIISIDVGVLMSMGGFLQDYGISILKPNSITQSCNVIHKQFLKLWHNWRD